MYNRCLIGGILLFTRIITTDTVIQIYNYLFTPWSSWNVSSCLLYTGGQNKSDHKGVVLEPLNEQQHTESETRVSSPVSGGTH